MILIDTLMVGRFSATELAYQAIGWAPVVVLTTAGVGLMIGTMVVTANALGRGQLEGCGIAWRRGMVMAGVIGLLAAVICQFGPSFLSATGQSAELSNEGGRVVAVLGLSLPATYFFVVTTFSLEGLKRPVPAMWVMLLANLVNIGSNWVLIYGQFGLPSMGAEGAAWSTVIVRWIQVFVLVGILLTMRDAAALGFRGAGWGIGKWADWQRQRSIGYASSLSILAESVSFATLAIMAGWLGNAPLAAYNIAHNVLATMFMVALGIGSATAVRVGFAHGQADHRNLAMAGWTGLGLNTVLMAAFGVVLWVFAPMVAGGFTTDVDVLALATAAMAIVPWLLIVDGGQVVMANAARGRSDVWIPTVIQFVAYCVIMVPMGYLLGVRWDCGIDGLFYAVLLGSGAAVLLQCVRFAWLGRLDRRGGLVAAQGF
ncbi:MAG: MATE family efflux transporter [Alphaproteobacteria bacterium]|nr:MATE family efflux transporter [Alphaproteobacteria bacterium SS10]